MSSDAHSGPTTVIDYARSGPRRRDRVNLIVGVTLWIMVASVLTAYVVFEVLPSLDR